MTEAEFKLWATNVKGLPDSDALLWWNQLDSDANVDRDNLGFGGRKQLWVPNVQQCRERVNERYIDNFQEEASQLQRGSKEADRAALREHVERQGVSFADPFLRAHEHETPGQKRKRDENSAEKPSGASVKKVALEREVPKLTVAMDKDVKSLALEIEKAMRTAEQAAQAVKDTGHSLTDRVATAYKSTLQFRMQLGYRWQGNQDISSVQGGKGFMDSAWLFGFLPGSEKVNLPPNNAAMLRYLCAGTVDILLIDAVSLASAAKEKEWAGHGTLEAYLNTIEKWDASAIKACTEAGVHMKQCQLQKNQLLYVPMGYWLVEKAAKDEALVYGARKSFFAKSSKSKDGYAAIANVYRSSSRNMERMDAIAGLLGD